jgi:hypothetical protein
MYIYILYTHRTGRVEHTGAKSFKNKNESKREESHADDLNKERGIVSSRVAFVATIW